MAPLKVPTTLDSSSNGICTAGGCFAGLGMRESESERESQIGWRIKGQRRESPPPHPPAKERAIWGFIWLGTEERLG